MRVLLVDDNPEFLKAAERILTRTPHLEVVGRASSGEEAVDQTRALNPELVLINWTLPGMNGLEATRRITAQPDPPRVLILSPQDYPEYRLAAKEAGAEGFISQAEFGQKIPSFLGT
jgi:DNA-binding NarL/FixJ family response regulator